MAAFATESKPGFVKGTQKTHTPGPQLQQRGLRYYNPQLGRWISRDPIEERGGHNIYEYVHNRPISDHDHLGMISHAKCSERTSQFWSDNPRLKNRMDRCPVKITIACKCCTKSKTPDMTKCEDIEGCRGEWQSATKTIMLCENRITTWIGEAPFPKVFGHEVQHYLDSSCGGFTSPTDPSQDSDFNDCARRLCMEMRARKAEGSCTDSATCWGAVLAYVSIYPTCAKVNANVSGEFPTMVALMRGSCALNDVAKVAGW